MKVYITCEDVYEAQKLAGLIFVAEKKATYIKEILNVIGNEMVILVKDESAHSVVLKDDTQVEKFADFIQSVLEGRHQIVSTVYSADKVEIIKE